MHRPKEVTLSVMANVLGCAAGLVHFLFTNSASLSLLTLVAFVLVTGVVYLYLRAIWRGRRWSWWLALALGVLGIAYLPWSYEAIPTTSGRVVHLAQAVVGTVATVLLLLPRARAWFRPNNSFKPKPLRGSA